MYNGPIITLLVGGGGGGAIDTPTFTPKILCFGHVENVEKIAYFRGYK